MHTWRSHLWIMRVAKLLVCYVHQRAVGALRTQRSCSCVAHPEKPLMCYVPQGAVGALCMPRGAVGVLRTSRSCWCIKCIEQLLVHQVCCKEASCWCYCFCLCERGQFLCFLFFVIGFQCAVWMWVQRSVLCSQCTTVDDAFACGCWLARSWWLVPFAMMIVCTAA